MIYDSFILTLPDFLGFQNKEKNPTVQVALLLIPSVNPNVLFHVYHNTLQSNFFTRIKERQLILIHFIYLHLMMWSICKTSCYRSCVDKFSWSQCLKPKKKEEVTIIWMTIENWEVVARSVNERNHILQGHYRIITHMAGLAAFTLSDNILRIKDVGAALCQGPGSLTHSNAKAQH